MHKNLVEQNKTVNAEAVSENVTENERQRKAPSCQLPLYGAWMSWRGQSASVSQKRKGQLVTLTLLLPVCTKSRSSL